MSDTDAPVTEEQEWVDATTTYLVEPGWRIETGAHGAIWFLASSPEKEDRR